MMAEQALKADKETIAAHLSHITRRWHELGKPCLLEIVHLSSADQAEVKHVAHYKTDADSLALAADDIASMNTHRINCYATVNPVDANNRPKAGFRAKREHILAAFFHWADADDKRAAENIKNFVGPKWTFHVLTGRTPHSRPHVYWELDQPETDLAAWEARQRAIAATLATDPAVVDPPRIMRIAGTVNWPKPQKQAKGYIAERTELHIYTPAERPPVEADRMARAFNAAPAQAGSFTIETGGDIGLDRETARVKALSGEEWHNHVIRLVASYVAKGLDDDEIHRLTDPLTLNGYTVDQTRREVQDAIDGARRKGWTPQPQYADPAQVIPQQAPQPATSGIALEWFRDITPALTDSYIVKGLLGSDTMSVIYGPSNSGKTFFALDLTFHIAAGIPWRGRRVNRAGVLYLAAEGGKGVANRIAALKAEKGTGDIPLALRRAGLDLLKQEADLQIVFTLANEVKAASGGGKILIVIDTLSRVMAGGDENSAADMTALIRNIDAIREATNSHIMLVHHSGKDVARGARGHSSLRAATDTEIEVQNDDGNRAAIVTKQRDYQGGETFAFDLKPVMLGVDQDGDEVSSCVVEPTDSDEFMAARKAAKGRGKNQQIIMETFDQMVSEGMARGNPGGVGMPEAGQFWAVDLSELRRIAQGKMVGENTAKLFRQAWDALTGSDGLFVAGDNLAWRVDRRKK